jgi:hypothetical protein
MTTQEKAEKALEYFKRHQRGDDRIWVTKDEKPDWIVDMCHAAHDSGQMFPDDLRYEYIVEALDAISEADEIDEIETSTDIYTHDLTAWLHSRADRPDYCDMAQEEGLIADDATTWQRLTGGQYTEKREILDSLIGFLENLDEEGIAA